MIGAYSLSWVMEPPAGGNGKGKSKVDEIKGMLKGKGKDPIATLKGLMKGKGVDHLQLQPLLLHRHHHHRQRHLNLPTPL